MMSRIGSIVQTSEIKIYMQVWNTMFDCVWVWRGRVNLSSFLVQVHRREEIQGSTLQSSRIECAVARYICLGVDRRELSLEIWISRDNHLQAKSTRPVIASTDSSLVSNGSDQIVSSVSCILLPDQRTTDCQNYGTYNIQNSQDVWYQLS